MAVVVQIHAYPESSAGTDQSVSLFVLETFVPVFV